MPSMPHMGSSSMMSRPAVWLGAAAAAGVGYWWYSHRDTKEHTVTVKREAK